jgi:putative MATE family efflux protein
MDTDLSPDLNQPTTPDVTPGSAHPAPKSSGQSPTNSPEDVSSSYLLRQLILLSLPVLAEHILHMLVGLTDTALANRLGGELSQPAVAAVGTITYILWFVGLVIGMVGTGSAAIIARAKGARHKSLANSVCGQSVTAVFIVGVVVAIFMLTCARPIADLTQLQGQAHTFALSYIRMLSFSVPFLTVMFIANACLRGSGDTITPAISMIVVDAINMIFTYGLARGAMGMPNLGFDGIAAGTVIAYIVGGLLQFFVLLRGRGGIRLHWHRLRPHWLTLKRILRVGLPAGLEGSLAWAAQFGILLIINRIDASALAPAAHNNAIRIESISFLTGFAVAAAAATLVGQSLGMRSPRRATRCAYLAYAIGASAMAIFGAIFVLAPHFMAGLLSPDNPALTDLTAQCLFITGWVQVGFAAAIVFGGVLRGAGDTFAVMILSLLTVFFVRFLGVVIVAFVFHGGLRAIWIVLCSELMIRGIAVFARFWHGGWRKIQV